ncbi:MAG: ATP-binding cassette domain-containing protein [Clostridia bacterium]|nr:ATP-binding cassette domain-containing protein [Clostridia bacterium]
MKALEITGLCKSYGDKTVLDNVSFSVDRGEIVGFLGPNGAGKSTTMNIVTGYLSPSKGEVRVCGINTLENPIGAKAKIGYLPEIPPLYQDMTVYEYLCFVFDLKKCKKDKKKHIAECMALVKLMDVAHRMIRNLSKGYKQRVGLAQALIGDPEVLILDEPTVGLDPSQIMEIRDVIRLIGREKTVILSTHILQEVTAVCDKVIIIHQGKIRACDTLLSLESGGINTYRITAMSDAASAAGILEAMGVEYEEAECGEEAACAFNMKTSEDTDIRAQVFNAFASAGIPLLEFTATTRSIEDVFRDYTDDEWLQARELEAAAAEAAEEQEAEAAQEEDSEELRAAEAPETESEDEQEAQQ